MHFCLVICCLRQRGGAEGLVILYLTTSFESEKSVKVCRPMLKRVAALHVTKNIGCLSNGIRTELHILGPATLTTGFLLICEVSQRLVDYSFSGVSVVRGGRSCCCLACYCQSLWDGVY